MGRMALQDFFSRLSEWTAFCSELSMGKKRKNMRGTVEKIIKPASPMELETAQITIPEADDLYREGYDNRNMVKCPRWS